MKNEKGEIRIRKYDENSNGWSVYIDVTDTYRDVDPAIVSVKISPYDNDISINFFRGVHIFKIEDNTEKAIAEFRYYESLEKAYVAISERVYPVIEKQPKLRYLLDKPYLENALSILRQKLNNEIEA